MGKTLALAGELKELLHDQSVDYPAIFEMVACNLPKKGILPDY